MIYKALRNILNLTLILGVFIYSSVNASLYFVTEENAVNADSFILDFDDTSSDYIDLEFGDALTSRLRYDVINNKFIFNENLDMEGNEVQNLRIENLASAPTCDATAIGRIYYNTTDKLTYSCDGVSTWNPLENALNATIEFPVVQARRTTSYTLTTTFTDIDLDTTDLENDTTTLDHDDTNRDRINIGATAMYQIIYGYTAGGSATSTHEARARVRVNDTTVLHGSESVNTNYNGEFSTTSASFLANLSDGDYISFQLQRDSTSDTTQDEIYFSIVKLEGIKGEKGDTGAAGPSTDSETFTIDNDNTGGDLSLVFGQSLNERLTWDSVNSEFDLSDDLHITGGLEISGSFKDKDGDVGTSGQILSSTATGTDWIAAPSLSVTKEIIGYVFSAGKTTSSGTNSFNINSSVSRTATGRFSVSFTTAHPNGSDYDIALGVEEDSTNRDGRIIQVVEGSQTANGFDIMILVGDNGGTADTYVDETWFFNVSATKEVVTDVSLN